MPARSKRTRKAMKPMRAKKGRKTHRRAGGVKRFMNVETAADIPAFERMLKKGPIVVGMFYLSWCGHCKKAEPSFKDVASKNYPGVSFAMVNSDLKDKTSLRAVEVNGVPDFFVSVPNKGGNAPNSTIKPEMSYDKSSIERLATVASNAASMGSADPTTLSASLNNKAGPPPFLAINAPSLKSNSLNVQPPSFRNLGTSGSLASSGSLPNNFNKKYVKTVEEEPEEPINAVSEESTDEEAEDELMVPSYESTIVARESINKGKNSLIKPAMSLAGEEPSTATTLSITSPVEAVSSVTSSLPESTLKAASREEKEKAEQTLREKEIAEGRNFSMIGGAVKKAPISEVQKEGSILYLEYDFDHYKVKRGSTIGGKSYEDNYVYVIKYFDDEADKASLKNKPRKKKMSAETPSKLYKIVKEFLAGKIEAL
jgi:thiol-disulfide isomerase/thioredoxin